MSEPTSGLLLTPEERLRFSAYCQQQKDSCRLIAEQMEKMVHSLSESFAKRELAKSKAYAIVAMDLGMVEDMTIDS